MDRLVIDCLDDEVVVERRSSDGSDIGRAVVLALLPFVSDVIGLVLASLALEIDGVPQLAAVYDPNRRELFTAERGRGAFLNGVPMRVSQAPSLIESVLVTGASGAVGQAAVQIVSALGGIIWGSMLGVDVHLALVGLKVFPVVILGGLDSVGGALVGGLIIGIVESLVAGYLDPYVGGGTKDFAPYVLMIIVLMIKPYGIFGKRRIERV